MAWIAWGIAVAAVAVAWLALHTARESLKLARETRATAELALLEAMKLHGYAAQREKAELS